MSIGVIVTGGTIASTRDSSGEGLFAPRCGSELRALVAGLGKRLGHDVHIDTWRDAEGRPAPLLDSCDIDSQHWLAMSQQIDSLMAHCSAVVVLHGTDTLAYTSSALSMLAPRRPGPVILTGSQVPLLARGSDAEANLSLALKTASGQLGDLAGDTVVAFGGKVMRGVRVTKYSTRDFEGFQSFNSFCMDDGEDSSEVLLSWQQERPTVSQPLTGFANGVVVLRVVPGMEMEWLRAAMLSNPPAGVVLELFGVGSSPQAQVLADVANGLSERGVPVVAVSACDHGGLDWRRYEATAPLSSSALIDGGDMRTEAAVVKLRGLLAGGRHEELETRFQASIAWECIRSI